MLAWIGALRRLARARAVETWSSRIAVGGTLGLGLSLACGDDPGPAPQFAAHCGDESGDTTCAVAYANKPYCSLCVAVGDNEGCVSSPPVPACRPGGGPGGDDDGVTGGDDVGSTGTGATAADSGTTEGSADTQAVDDTASSGTDTESSTPCTELGAVDRECQAADPARPFCIEGTCSDCADAGGDNFCGAFDPATPACDATMGACVPCFEVARTVCGEFTPVCDGVAGTCSACDEHAQCEGRACHLSPEDPRQGACFAEDGVVWVDGTNNCPGAGTEADPRCSLRDTVESFDVGDSGVIFLVAGDPYAEDLVFEQDATVAIVGVGSPSLTSNPATGQPTLSVSGGATVYIANVRLNDNETFHGLACDEASVIFSDAEIAGNSRWGVLVTSPCLIALHRTVVHHNGNGGIRMLGGLLAANNATIGENGDGSSGPGIQLSHAAIDLVYSTIAGNDGFGPDSMQCEGDVSGTVRNSVFNGVGLESIDLDCFALMFDNNALSSSAFGGGTNAEIGAYVSAYFTDPEDGDFRLAAPPLTPYGDVAQWIEGDPRLDADGTERPIDDVGYAGIDEP
ncbi:MAG: right-handed parallel beta-helix repeat-containing protein [Nannocystaceae bacterium]|nr:right-handed parallel beta-helix repeat-containing protein [Nannocystaceae bacterium]